jgi:hypothetical protein
MISMWTAQNNKRHGHNKESRDRARREVLHKELEDLYNRKHEYPARVQRLLQDSYETHTQETPGLRTDQSTSRGRAFISAAVVGRAIQSEWWESRRQPKDISLKINRVPGFLLVYEHDHLIIVIRSSCVVLGSYHKQLPSSVEQSFRCVAEVAPRLQVLGNVYLVFTVSFKAGQVAFTIISPFCFQLSCTCTRKVF